MLGCSSFGSFARGALSFTVSGASFLGGAGLLASCVPERALATYTAGGSASPASPSIATTTSNNFPDGGAVVESIGLPPVSDVPDAASAADAALPNLLACSDECQCERRDDRDFMFCGAVVTHDEATVRCAAAGGALVSVDDEERNDWLRERMLAAGAEDDFWLSGTDIDVEGVWRWQDGRVFFDQTGDGGATAAYVPWDVEQPNDLNGEDCMRSTGGVWRDLSCDDVLAFACQG
jgi:hypothetical protein